MTNPANTGTLIGRLANNKQVFEQADGSKVILATVAVDDNYVSGKGENRGVATQFISVRIFLPSSVEGLGSWDRVNKGDLISLQYRLGAKPYVKDGETVYPSVTVEVEGYPVFLETKATTQARAARNVVAEETPEQTIARLQAELQAKNEGTDYTSTTPFQEPVAAAA